MAVKTVKEERVTKGKGVKDTDAFMDEVRDHFDKAKTADQIDRAEAIEDLRFVNAKQWPESQATKRNAAKRPMLTINLLPGNIDQVVGEQRQNRPDIKVRAVDDDSDPDRARIREGLIRNISSQSDASIAYDNAFESAVTCGRGFFRILNEYTDDDSFEQDLKIKRISDCMTVLWDPEATDVNLTDAQYMFVYLNISKELYESKYPDKALSNFENMGDKTKDWVSGDKYRIAEYWYKVPRKKTIYLVEDESGNTKVVNELPKNAVVLKEREVDSYDIYWCKVSGEDILEGPYLWKGKYFPIVPIWGKEITVDGVLHRRGVIRYAKDSQRAYNYWRTSATEQVALAPKAPYKVTQKMIDGHEHMWNEADSGTKPYLLFNPDDRVAGGGPTRERPIDRPAAQMDEVNVSREEIQQTTGIYDAYKGKKSNEVSGVAIAQRRTGGERATFAYHDNLSRALRQCGRILIDLIPYFYDTQRVIRILGEDMVEELVNINSPSEDGNGLLNDMTVGKYDITLSTGPSFTTQRQETAQAMMELIGKNPDLMIYLGDLMVKNMDWKNTDEMAERIKFLQPPEFRKLVEEAEGGNKDKNNMLRGEEIEQENPEQADPMALIEQKKAEVELKKAEFEAALKGLELKQKNREIEEEPVEEKGGVKKSIVKVA